MPRYTGFIGMKLLISVVILSIALLGTTLTVVILSQPVEPQFELKGSLPAKKEHAFTGFVKAMNISRERMKQLSLIFSIDGVPENMGNMWVTRNETRSLIVSEPRVIHFLDSGFKCNTSNARPRDEFPDVNKTIQTLEKRLGEAGVFPDYERNLENITETIEPESKKICLLNVRFFYLRDMIPVDAGVLLRYDYSGTVIEFRSDVFEILTDGVIHLMDPQYAIDYLKRSMAHNFWSGKEYVEKVVVHRVILCYRYPLTGWRVGLAYWVTYDAIFTTGVELSETIYINAESS